MGLARYIASRLLMMIPTLLVLGLVIYYTTTFFPAGVRVMLYVSPFRFAASGQPDFMPRLIEMWHLNDPFHVQYMTWLGQVLKGNLGYSILYNQPVANVILSSFPTTFELVMYSAPIIILGGHKLGVFSAKRAHSKTPREDTIDFAVRTTATIGYSIPSFVLGTALLIIFFLYLGWFYPGRVSISLQDYVTPMAGWVSHTGLLTIDGFLNGRSDIALDAFRHLVLPVITLVAQNLAILVRVTRSSMVSELFKPYIVTARAKGLPQKEVIRHAERNSLISTLTVSGVLFANMLTGVIVTEYVFNLRGMGYLAMQAASRFDYPLLVGVALFFCVIFMFVNLIVDITCAHVDPRVKL